jgi:hypothetical protein
MFSGWTRGFVLPVLALTLGCSSSDDLTREQVKNVAEQSELYKRGIWDYVRTSQYRGACDGREREEPAVEAGYFSYVVTYPSDFCTAEATPKLAALPPETPEGLRAESNLMGNPSTNMLHVRALRFTNVEVTGVTMDPGGVTAVGTFTLTGQLTDSGQRYLPKEQLDAALKPYNGSIKFQKFDDGWRPVVPNSGPSI